MLRHSLRAVPSLGKHPLRTAAGRASNASRPAAAFASTNNCNNSAPPPSSSSSSSSSFFSSASSPAAAAAPAASFATSAPAGCVDSVPASLARSIARMSALRRVALLDNGPCAADDL
ncbi:hypothetical protein HDU87_005835 [Geranomyces variabilis]|uniref:Uncharacterized protein n=1 Tax=Geranomyces variabilis TaxID=109894 RepID=A0AAD5TIM5_9FUNG|nr:hypothetical protein HDU87_005835 [Geranomyces variabilis]